MTIKFDERRVTPAIRDDINEFVLSLKEIKPQFQKDVIDASQESLTVGGGMRSVVFEALQNTDIEKEDALRLTALIANRSQWLLDTDQRIKIGLTKARWKYAGAPCVSSRHPTKREMQRDERHKKADGRTFDIREGLLINGKRYFPGLEYGCKCTAETILPGWNDKK